MALSPGSRIGSYEVQGLLGAGGMGEVYRARDTSLGRDVAIKVLPASVASDAERLARFEREAKLLASLSHANIAQIYGLERSPAGAALVMELAPGEDLTAHISRGALPLQDALQIAIQIAQALEAAHDAGIIHRDLKPANIKVTADGAVKVLDFGLAKALDPAAASGSANAANSPTLTAQATAAGIILGTAAYMSPEQARGRDADKRADVWSFGVVFFEMLTGARLFQGETISDTLAAVLRQEIPWSTLPAATPSEITKLLRRCLERDRKNRLHDIADVRIVLDEVSRGGAMEDVRPLPSPAGRAWWPAIVVGAIALALAFAGGRWSAPKASATAANTVRLVVPRPPGVLYTSDPAVSPDGSFVVFVGHADQDKQLYIQRFNESAPKAIGRTEGGDQPFVSADGKWIGYQKQNRLERIAVEGGDPILIAELPHTGGPGATWLSNGTVVFGSMWLGGLSAVAQEGGAVRPVSTLDSARGEIGHWFPSALPGARHVLMTVWTKATGINDAEVALLDVDTGKHQVLFKGAEGRYLSPGYIVFFRAGAYHAIRFNPETGTVSGESVRVLDDASGNPPEGDQAQASLGPAGTFAYLSGGSHIMPRELAWISENGKIEPLGYPVRPYRGGTISGDGKRLAISAIESGRYVMRILALDRHSDEPLDLPGSAWDPVWQPGTTKIAFTTMRKGDFDAYWVDVGTQAPPEALLVTEFDESPNAFTPDGSALIVQQSDKQGRYRHKLLRLPPHAAPEALIDRSADTVAVSHDARFVAYQSSHQGSSQIYVQSMDGKQFQRIGNGTAAIWAVNKRDLLYLREPDIMAMPFVVQNGQFIPGKERVWAHVPGNYYAGVLQVGRDGRALVLIDRKATARELRVIVNWQQEIAAKVK